MNPFFVQQLMKIKPPYNVNSAAVVAGLATLTDKDWKEHPQDNNPAEKESSGITKYGFEVSPLKNLLFVKVKNNFEELRKRS